MLFLFLSQMTACIKWLFCYEFLQGIYICDEPFEFSQGYMLIILIACNILM